MPTSATPTTGRRPSARLGPALVALTVLLLGCSGAGPEGSPGDDTVTSPPDAGDRGGDSGSPEPAGDLRAEDLVTGLTSPWGLVVLRDGSLLVSERDTTEIKHLPAGGGPPATIATLTEARPAGEAGLLGLAVTPAQDRVLAYYTSETDNRIVTMTWDGRRLGPPEVIFSGIPIGDGDRHEGGGLVVGPDDLLYVGTGETGDTPEIAQDRDSLGGKVLRLTLQGDPAPDNPFGTAVYSLGHRNVEGLAFDDRGRLWSSEFGDSTWDELNLIEAGGNYGWPEVEGSSDREEFVDPKVVWSPDRASPAGLAHWDGSLWMAGLRGETLWEIPLTGGGADPGAPVTDPVAHLVGEWGRLRAVAVGPDGESLLVGTSNTDGRGDPRDGDDRLLTVTR